MKNPLVTVLISSYNQREYIESAITSVVNQDYPKIEIIVIDDSSTDGSQELIKKISSEFGARQIDMIFKSKNEGNVYCRNIGLSEAAGEYVCFLDGDDIYLPQKISTQVSYMESNKDWMFSCHDVEVFNSANGKSIFFYSERYGAGKGTASELISKGMYIQFGSIMFRKKYISNHRFDTQLYMGEDWLFTIDVLMAGNRKFSYMDEVLSKYRRHTTNKTLNWEEKIRNNFKMVAVMETKYKSMKFEIRSRKSELYFILAVYSFLNKELFATNKAILNYIIYSFPNVLRFSRILYREIKFFVKNKFQFDAIIRSLWSSL